MTSLSPPPNCLFRRLARFNSFLEGVLTISGLTIGELAIKLSVGISAVLITGFGLITVGGTTGFGRHSLIVSGNFASAVILALPIFVPFLSIVCK